MRADIERRRKKPQADAIDRRLCDTNNSWLTMFRESVCRWIMHSESACYCSLIIVHGNDWRIRIATFSLFAPGAYNYYTRFSIPVISVVRWRRQMYIARCICVRSRGFQHTYKRPNRIWGSGSVPFLCQYWRTVEGHDCARPICTLCGSSSDTGPRNWILVI